MALVPYSDERLKPKRTKQIVTVCDFYFAGPFLTILASVSWTSVRACVDKGGPFS